MVWALFPQGETVRWAAALRQGVVSLDLAFRTVAGRALWGHLQAHPARLLALSYITLSALGALLLSVLQRGFSTWSSSLIAYRGDLLVNLVMGFLIIVGGLGFSVLAGLVSLGRWRGRASQRRARRSVHERLVVPLTAVLLAGQRSSFLGQSLRELQLPERHKLRVVAIKKRQLEVTDRGPSGA